MFVKTYSGAVFRNNGKFYAVQRVFHPYATSMTADAVANKFGTRIAVASSAKLSGGVLMMNRSTSNSHWSDLEAIIMQDLAGVTDRDLAACGGSRDKLVEKLQEIYGISPDEAEGAVTHYEHRLASWYDSASSRAIN